MKKRGYKSGHVVYCGGGGVSGDSSVVTHSAEVSFDVGLDRPLHSKVLRIERVLRRVVRRHATEPHVKVPVHFDRDRNQEISQAVEQVGRLSRISSIPRD